MEPERKPFLDCELTQAEEYRDLVAFSTRAPDEARYRAHLEIYQTPPPKAMPYRSRFSSEMSRWLSACCEGFFAVDADGSGI